MNGRNLRWTYLMCIFVCIMTDISISILCVCMYIIMYVRMYVGDRESAGNWVSEGVCCQPVQLGPCGGKGKEYIHVVGQDVLKPQWLPHYVTDWYVVCLTFAHFVHIRCACHACHVTCAYMPVTCMLHAMLHVHACISQFLHNMHMYLHT